MFPDDHELGTIHVRQSATLNGTRIESSETSAPIGPAGHVTGDFYDADGSVAAGFFAQGESNNPQYVFGGYIVSSGG